MKFKIVRSKFMDALKSVQNIVSGKTTVPILQNVRIETLQGKLKMTTSDLEITIDTLVDCDIVEDGKTTLPVKMLVNSVMKAPEGEIEVKVDEMEKATITAVNTRFKLSGLPEEKYPHIDKEEKKNKYTISQSVFREMLRKTNYATAQDETRRSLRGILLSFKDEKLTMVATDGKRLAMVEQELEFPKDSEIDIVLTSRVAQEIMRLLTGENNIDIYVSEKQVCIDLGETQVYSKLMEEKYPNYTQVIPTESKEKINVDRQLLIDAIERASVITMDEAHSIRLIFEGNKLIVTSAASEVFEAKDEVPIKYAGDKIEIIFNPSYVMEPLRAIDDDEVTFNINGGDMPAVIRCCVPFLYVIMPLRIN